VEEEEYIYKLGWTKKFMNLTNGLFSDAKLSVYAWMWLIILCIPIALTTLVLSFFSMMDKGMSKYVMWADKHIQKDSERPGFRPWMLPLVIFSVIVLIIYAGPLIIVQSIKEKKTKKLRELAIRHEEVTIVRQFGKKKYLQSYHIERHKMI
jgi:uncharacterized membrane protein